MRTKTFTLLLVGAVVGLSGCCAPAPQPVAPPERPSGPADFKGITDRDRPRDKNFAADLATEYLAKHHDGGAMKRFEVENSVAGKPWTRYTLLLEMVDGRKWNAVVTVWAWRDSHTVDSVKLVE